MFKWLVGGIALVAALAGLLMIGKRTLDDARASGRSEERAVWLDKERAADKVRADLEHSLGVQMTERFDKMTGLLVRAAQTEAQINVRLPQAIAAAPRYRDPNCALTPEVLGHLNAARALSQ